MDFEASASADSVDSADSADTEDEVAISERGDLRPQGGESASQPIEAKTARRVYTGGTAHQTEGRNDEEERRERREERKEREEEKTRGERREEQREREERESQT